MHDLCDTWKSNGILTRFPMLYGVVFFLFALTFCFPSPVSAADSFVRVVMESDSRAAGAAEVAPVDMDGDGDSDALVAAESGTLAWLENDATRVNFVFHRIDLGVGVAGARDVDPVDFDGDGDVDLVTAVGDTFAWYENDGTNTGWTRHVIDAGPHAAGASDIDAADFNGNGFMDLLTAAADTFAWYENDGTDLTFTRFVIAAGVDASGARDNDPVDFDGDGDMDAVTVAAGDTVAWYENHNPQPDRFRRREVASGAEIADARDVEFADIDGDGSMDLAVAAGDTFVWFRNRGNDKKFNRHVIDAGPTAAGAADVDPVDFDRDGAMDFITAATTAGVLAWYENKGNDVSFTRHVIEQGAHAAGARDIESADVDLDGDWDVMTAAAGAGEFAWQAQPNVFVVDDDGSADTGPLNCGALTPAPAAVSGVLDRVTVGDTVWVCPGAYRENLRVNAGQSHLKLVATGDSTNTVLAADDPTRSVLEVSGARGVLIDGMNLRGPPVRFSGVRGMVFRNNRLDSDVGRANQMELLDSDTNVIRANLVRARPDTAVVLDQDSDSNLLVGNRFVNTRDGLVLAGSSDFNVVRDNRIDTHFVGVSIVHQGGVGPEGNRLENNTIRAANTGIVISGTGGNGPRNVATNNNIASNYEGVENVTDRIFDARGNWWGDITGPGGIPGDENRDPFTGSLADGAGDSIVSVDADGNRGPDMNVAYEPWLDTQAVQAEPLPDQTNGCLIERMRVPPGTLQSLRKLRDGVLHTEAGRTLTRLYYRFFGAHPR